MNVKNTLKLSAALLLLLTMGLIALPSSAIYADAVPDAPARELVYFGVVRLFDEEKGYGYITSPDFELDVYVHKSNCFDTIRKGDKVSFNIAPGRRGLNAMGVRLVERPE